MPIEPDGKGHYTYNPEFENQCVDCVKKQNCKIAPKIEPCGIRLTMTQRISAAEKRSIEKFEKANKLIIKRRHGINPQVRK